MRPRMRRRALLHALGAGGTAALAGCIDRTVSPAPVSVGATTEFVAATPTAEVAGTWLAEEFRARTETVVQWETPPDALDAYVARHLQGRPLDAAAFLGVTRDALIAARDRVPELFAAPADPTRDRVSAVDLDPRDRVVPVTTSNVCLVYDETRVTPPESLDDLLTPRVDEAGLLVPDPRTDTLGRAFFAWSVHEFGVDAACERWRRVLEAGARLVPSWAAAYEAYQAGAAPMLVGTATTPLFAARQQRPLERYRVRFLDDAAYRHVAGVGRFAAADRASAADEFVDFLLEPAVQGRLAVLTGALPVVDDADLPQDFETYVRHPETTVTHDYGTLAANLDDWLAAWQRVVTAART